MSDGLKLLISLSISASIISIILFAIKPFIKYKLSKRWQYYIWLIVILRLVIPFSPETSIIGELLNKSQNISNQSNTNTYLIDNQKYYKNEEVYTDSVQNNILETNVNNVTNYFEIVKSNILFILIFISILLIVKKVTSYLSFVRYIKAGRKNINDEEIFELFQDVCVELKIKKIPPLYSNNIISSSMLVGIIKPFVVIPESQLLVKENLRYVFLHELVHLKRYDIYYKWFVQIAICIHWYNPVMYFIRREINNACELSCDEEVIKRLDDNGIRSYGDTLISSLELGGDYGNEIVSVTLCENGKFIKERLNSIMNFRKKSKFTIIISIILIAVFSIGTVVLGAYRNNETLKITKIEFNQQVKQNTKVNNTDSLKKPLNNSSNIDDINDLLPFMSEDTVDEIAKKYLNTTNDIEEIKNLIPFMNDYTIDEIAKEYLNTTNNIEDIKSLIPFMNDYTIDEIAKKYLNTTNNIEDIKSLIPFMNEDSIDEIAKKYLNTTSNIEDIKSLIPFMNEDSIVEIAKKYLNSTNNIEDIKSLIPFMDEYSIDEIAKNYLNSTNNIEDIKSLIPFMSKDAIDEIVKDNLGIETNINSNINQNGSNYSDNKYEYGFGKSITYNLQSINHFEDISLFADYNKYEDFTYDSENEVWLFNNKPMRFFNDKISDTKEVVFYNNTSELAKKSGIGVKVVRNDDKSLTFVEMTQEEMEEIYNRSDFVGLFRTK